MSKTPLPKVTQGSVNMGCDPEFFFSKEGAGVIGSEAILPKEGLQTNGGKIVIDGVQAELNPHPSTCRESLAHNIRSAFFQLDAEMKKKDPKAKLDFSRSIEISKEEMAKLDKANQALGCMPSLNVSKNKTAIKLSEVDGSKHLQRSAGGHIHMSGSQGSILSTHIQWNPDELVQMLDLIVGNTCVMLDRDPSNKERRKLYGRAGEFRLPKYKIPNTTLTTPGLEYRTLSNFWLTAYPLMSLVFGLARTTMELCSDPLNGRFFYEEFTKAVPYAKVRHAINYNNTALAEEIYRTIEPMLFEVIPEKNSHFPINKGTQKEFNHFLKKVSSDGLEYWFKQDPMSHWLGLTDISSNGFYNWSASVVEPDRVKSQTILGKVQTAIGL